MFLSKWLKLKEIKKKIPKWASNYFLLGWKMLTLPFLGKSNPRKVKVMHLNSQYSLHEQSLKKY